MVKKTGVEGAIDTSVWVFQWKSAALSEILMRSQIKQQMNTCIVFTASKLLVILEKAVQWSNKRWTQTAQVNLWMEDEK